jgi:hypothetical protein
MKIDWEIFKSDVNLKNLVQHIDRGVDRRTRLFIANQEKFNVKEEQQDKILNFMKWYKKLHPIHSICLFIYIFGCFFERPAWCIQDNLDPNLNSVATSGSHYWFCRDD